MLARSAESLYRQIRKVLHSARADAYRAVNTAMVQSYWNVGRLIVEHEQGGAKRAAYGIALLEHLSRRLTTDFGVGYTVTNLRHCATGKNAIMFHLGGLDFARKPNDARWNQVVAVQVKMSADNKVHQ